MTSKSKSRTVPWRAAARALRGAIVGPFWAALPLAALAFAAFLAGYPSDLWFVEAAFVLLSMAWPAAILVGVPLHLLLNRIGLHGGLARLIAGALLAVAVAWLIPGIDSGEGAAVVDWEPTHWVALALYGAAAGAIFWRAARLPGPVR